MANLMPPTSWDLILLRSVLIIGICFLLFEWSACKLAQKTSALSPWSTFFKHWAWF